MILIFNSSLVAISMFLFVEYFAGAVLLDHEGKDLTNVMSSIVNELVNIGYINDETGSEILRVLLYRHKYVDSKIPYWKSRNQSIISISVRTDILARKAKLISIDFLSFPG